MNMEDILDRLLMRSGSHMTATLQFLCLIRYHWPPTFWYIKHALLLVLLDLVISFLATSMLTMRGSVAWMACMFKLPVEQSHEEGYGSCH